MTKWKLTWQLKCKDDIKPKMRIADDTTCIVLFSTTTISILSKQFVRKKHFWHWTLISSIICTLISFAEKNTTNRKQNFLLFCDKNELQSHDISTRKRDQKRVAKSLFWIKSRYRSNRHLVIVDPAHVKISKNKGN